MIKHILSIMVAVVITGNGFAQGDDNQETAASKAKVGMNLAGLADWATAYPLVDIFKSSRSWVSQKNDAKWGSGPELELDAQGWIKNLTDDCYAEVPFFPHTAGAMPAGEYVVLYDGQGDVKLRGVKPIEQTAGRITFVADETTSTSWLTIASTDPADYIRNIRILLPGSEATYQEDPWNPQFLARWKGVECLRFMEWMETNHSKIAKWEERPLVESASYSSYAGGVPLELMIDLCNRLETNGWFCMPHLADDEYIRKTAEMVQEKLNPKLKAYVEFSNEVWNSQFKQTKINTAKAKELEIGNPEMPWEGNGMLYARRAVDVGKIWHDVFEDDSRVVRVLAWQCSAYWLKNILLPFEDAFQNVDAVAIAPYINLAAFPKSSEKTPNAEEIAQWSEDQLLDHVEQECLPVAINHMEEIIAVVAAKNLDLIVYEGGQHMVGVGGGENNEEVTALLMKANLNPRMKGMYQEYFKAWDTVGGGLFCYFTSTSGWSKWGSWGVLDRYDADPAKSPKYLALIEWAQQLGQKMELQDNSKQP